MSYCGDLMSPNSRRVLIVEDLQDSAETLAVMLRLMGHEVEYVTDALMALDVAKRLRPQLIFLDIGMPKLDGYALAAKLREEFGFESLRLVALTAWGRAEDRARARQAGFDAHVLKPADPAILESILETLQ